MANPVQFKASSPTIPALKINNFYIGTVGTYGPSSATDYYASFDPTNEGSNHYSVITNLLPTSPFDILVYDNDGLLSYFRGLGYDVGQSSQLGRGFSTASQQDDICVINKDLEPIYPGTTTGKLSLYLDAGFTPCFASGSDTAIIQGNFQTIGELTGTLSPAGTTQRYSAGNGGAISFDSANRDKITTNLKNNSIFQSAFAMEFWVYVNGAQSDGTLFYKAPTGTTNSLEISIVSSGKISITVGADTRTTSTATVTQDDWNLISIQLTSNSNSVKINNGTAETATRTAIGSALTNITSTAAVVIGTENGANNFNGKLAIFALYSENLGQAAQLQNWNALKSRFGLS